MLAETPRYLDRIAGFLPRLPRLDAVKQVSAFTVLEDQVYLRAGFVDIQELDDAVQSFEGFQNVRLVETRRRSGPACESSGSSPPQQTQNIVFGYGLDSNGLAVGSSVGEPDGARGAVAERPRPRGI